MPLCHCQIKGCTVWWRGRRWWALMDWKGMCFSSKWLSVNKDLLLLPEVEWLHVQFLQVLRWRGRPGATKPILTVQFRFLIPLATQIPGLPSQRSGKSYSTFGSPLCCHRFKQNVQRHSLWLLSSSWTKNRGALWENSQALCSETNQNKSCVILKWCCNASSNIIKTIIK